MIYININSIFRCDTKIKNDCWLLGNKCSRHVYFYIHYFHCLNLNYVFTRFVFIVDVVLVVVRSAGRFSVQICLYFHLLANFSKKRVYTKLSESKFIENSIRISISFFLQVIFTSIN